MSSNINVIKKVSVVGLSNAGKTTLLRTLQHQYNIGDIPPTKNVERTQLSIFNSPLLIWDFGGQSSYREQYLANPDRYFSDVALLYYVIDMQDASHYPDSLEYFQKIYQNTISNNPNVIVVVLLNKVDPVLVHDTKVKGQIESLKKELQKMTEGNEIMFYITTVFDPLSVLEAFSKPLLGSQPIYNSLSVLFANYAMTHNVESINLIIDDLFELGSFRVKDPSSSFVEATMKFYQQFSNIEITQKLRKYELEGYSFLILKGRIADFLYTLNIAYKINTDPNSQLQNPADSDISALLSSIEEAFRKYHPKLR